ncbi:myb-related protein Zm1-like [Oryza brachyantha]|uniref:Uncharacterized protein n=1 Tax=Oryza brachyantha TaxID=4533 RepID=J3MK06_ORYBR|nr:myb-related protein Zm1-like [Oryza brachyantha]
MAAGGNSFLNEELAMAANGMSGRFFTGSSHGGVGSIGMPPSSFVMPEEGLAAVGYGDLTSIPVGANMVPQQQQIHVGGSNGNLGVQKGVWTREEDEVLRKLVRHHGVRKWAEIAKSLPGRIGKQCRERWTNHLQPDIKKDIWTEDEDNILIEAHKSYGNCWSVLAKFLHGRPENAIKNHWNTTRRRLNSKRQLRKKNGKHGGPSPLEEYIRSCIRDERAHATRSKTMPTPLPATAEAAGAAFGVVGYGTGQLVGVSATPPLAMQAPDSTATRGTVTFLDLLNGDSPRPQPETMNLFHVPAAAEPEPHLPTTGYCLQLDAGGNLYYGRMPPAPVPPHEIELQAQNLSLYHQPAASFAWSHLADSGAASNQASGYYGDAGAGPSGAGAGADNNNVSQMASSEFMMPSEDEAILDLARWTN